MVVKLKKKKKKKVRRRKEKERKNDSFRGVGSCQNLLNGIICNIMFFLSLQESGVLLPADGSPI